MKKLFLLFVTIFSFALQASNCFDWSCENINIYGDIGAGYRQDTLVWTFPGHSDNVAIHEKWKDLNMGYLEANIRAMACDTYLLKLDFDYGWSGWSKKQRITIKDYNYNVFLPLDKTKTKAQVYDFSAGVGYKMDVTQCHNLLTFTPLAGWSTSHQKFKGHTFYTYNIRTSRYLWTTPWIGFETVYNPLCNLIVYLDYSYHFGYFHTKIDEFFYDRRHRLTAYGDEAELGSVYHWCDNLWICCKLNYKHYWTHPTDATSGAIPVYKRRVDWTSWRLGVDVGYEF